MRGLSWPYTVGRSTGVQGRVACDKQIMNLKPVYRSRVAYDNHMINMNMVCVYRAAYDEEIVKVKSSGAYV